MSNRPAIPEMLKKLIFQEADSSCPFCGNRDVAALEIHHILPYHESREHAPGNLILTCANCHRKITAGVIAVYDVFQKKREVVFKAGLKASTSTLMEPHMRRVEDLAHLSLSRSFLALGAIMDRLDSPPAGKCRPPNPREIMRAVDSDAMLVDSIISWDPLSEDPNGKPWAQIKALKTYDSIDGFWASRWRLSSAGGFVPMAYREYFEEDSPTRLEDSIYPPTTWSPWREGNAKIKRVGDWVFIEYEDDSSKYIIKARMILGKRLVGRYLNCKDERDSSPWVANIFSARRIDGFWHPWLDGIGRWDFQR